jgi:hypothetical protein
VIARLGLIARMLSFAAVCWVLAVIVWGMMTGTKQIETPKLAVWLFLGGLLAQLLLWLLGKAVRRV